MIDFASTLDEYVYDLRAQNRNPRTIDNYCRSLRGWHDWLIEQREQPELIEELRKEHIAPYLAWRADLDAPGTVLTKHRHLRAFCKWLEREELIVRSPMATLREPSVPEQPVPILTTEDLRAILATTRKDKSWAGIRDYTIILTLADTGVRVGELCGMTREDIDFESGTIEVLGKFSRRRRVAFSARTGKALHAYLRARAKERSAAATDRLWIGVRGPLQVAAVWSIVKHRSEDADVKGVFPHRFRHTMAHRFRVQGGQEGDLAALGGWRGTKMLQRYGASAATERAIAAHRRVDHLGDV
jgi:site-specific recombinase XerD